MKPLKLTRAVAGACLWLPAAMTAVPGGYLALISVAGSWPLPRDRTSAGDRTRFAILVPAHDEAGSIGTTLDSFRELHYPPDRFQVHVVADNCTDETAEIVTQSGWEAHVRFDPERPGKGPALNWLYDRLIARGDCFDAVVIVDADTSLDAGFLSAMDVALGGGAVAAQGYYSVREPDASSSATFRYAALACRHHLRPLGRSRIGGSCGLFGNGMAFATPLLAQHRWSGHLVEDAELQNELLLDGQLVRYVPDAVLWAEMPNNNDAATSQNERWERGRIELCRRYVPQFVRRLAQGRGPRVAQADAVLDHLLPPLSVLVGGQLLAIVVTGAISATGSRAAKRACLLATAGLVATVAHVLTGLRSVQAPRHHYRALVNAPRQIAWKIALWFRVLARGSDVTWSRTRRNTEDA